VRTLELERRGLEILRSPAIVTSPSADGRALTLWADQAAAVSEIAAFSARDAGRYPAFLASVAAVSSVLRALLNAPPPPLDDLSVTDLMGALRTGRRFRALGRTDAYRLLRWLPMSAADLVGESFESEPLSAVVAADGTFGSFLGPRSAGSGALLLLMAAREGRPIAPGWAVRGGPGAIGAALASAARQAGAEIRTGVEVRQIVVREGAARGIVLEGGEEIAAERVVSGADPRHTLLHLVDPVHLGPALVQQIRSIRMRGALAKVNFAVSGLPPFAALAGVDKDRRETALSGCVRLARSVDAIERAFDAAKYGALAEEPWIELTIPSLTDPGLAPAGAHVVSAYVQFAPFALAGSTWDAERDRLQRTVVRTIERDAPGFARSIVACEVITPLDLERTYGLTGGHAFHGELALDQLLLARPLIGWANYRTPIRNLYLCGAGTHPGVGVYGRSGALAARAILDDASSKPA
jgi:phytoene dehydrogenase-like protein